MEGKTIKIENVYEFKKFKSEIVRLNNQIFGTESKLKNIGFLENAGPDKIKNEKNKLRDFKAQLVSILYIVQTELSKLIEEPFISYFIEEIRFSKFDGDIFSESYFDIVNGNNITDIEKEELLHIIKNDELLNLFKYNLSKYDSIDIVI